MTTTKSVAYYWTEGHNIDYITPVNSAVLVTDGGGVPTLSTTLPNFTFSSATSGGTLTVNNVSVGGDFKIVDGSFNTHIVTASSAALSADRTLTLNMQNVAHTLAFSATANTITFPNTASYTVVGSLDTDIKLAGNVALSSSVVPNYHIIYGKDGANKSRIALGYTSDVSIYYDTTTHNFRSADGSVSFFQVSSGGLVIQGATSGGVGLKVPAVAGSNLITLPAGTTDFSATGGVGQVVRQANAGGAFTVGLDTGYTVAGLPAAAVGLKGARAYVTDATAPTFLGALTGGGAIVTPVFCNGAAWVAG